MSRFSKLTNQSIAIESYMQGIVKEDAAEIAGLFGALGLGLGAIVLVDKAARKLFGLPNEKYFDTSKPKDEIQDIKNLSKEFMSMQKINSSERRNVYNTAKKIVKDCIPKELVKEKKLLTVSDWEDPAEFYKGEINAVDLFWHSYSWLQWVPEETKDTTSQERDVLVKNWKKMVKTWEVDVNKEMNKKFGKTYRVFFEDIENGSYWDYYGIGDGDESCIVLVDVDTVNRLKRYLKSHQVTEAYQPHVNHVCFPEDKEACDEYFQELSEKYKPVGFSITENDYKVPPNVENFYDDSCVGMAIFQKAKSTNMKILETWLTKLNKECHFCSFQAYKFNDTKFYITAYFD